MDGKQLLVLLLERYKQNGNAKELWNYCERGDWMLWVAVKLEVDKKHVVKAACECAKISLHLVPEGEERPRKAIETALAWTEGNASLEDVQRAYVASAAFAVDTTDFTAAYAAAAATYAAVVAAAAVFATAYAATYAAAAAAVAAYAAADFATYAIAYAVANAIDVTDTCAKHTRSTVCIEDDAKDTGDAARCKALGQCAELVRAVIPWELVDAQFARRKQ
jgi:hypothetical protein